MKKGICWALALSIGASLALPGRCGYAETPVPAPANTASAPSSAASADQETIAKLRDVAYGKTPDGKFKEPSSRIREAARQALVLYEASLPNSNGAAKPADDDNMWAVISSSQPDRTRLQPDFEIVDPAKAAPVQLTNFQPVPAPIQPVAPPTTVQPSMPPTGMGGNNDDVFSRLAFVPSLDQMLAERAAAPAGTPVGGVGAKDAQLMGSSDTAALLSQAGTAPDVSVQLRLPISYDPHIRGYKWGQIYTEADGAYWTPARLDLDTMLSKIDPGMIDTAEVIPGPYGLRFGPGFSFIDVNRQPTPRSSDGFQPSFDTTGNVRSNGSQLYGRETASGGGSDWGVRMSYGIRSGSDYSAGNGDKMPSAYHSQDVWTQLGYDLNPHQHAEIAFQRLDQTNTEYPGQFFDLNLLMTNGFQGRIIDDDPMAPWSKMTMEGWYNNTHFSGDTSHKTDPAFPVISRVNWALDQSLGGTNSMAANTVGDAYSSGGRLGMVFGEKDCTQLRTGADFRYLGQSIGESFSIASDINPLLQFNTNLPHASMVDSGVYAELAQPMTDAWTMSIGARLDYVRTSADASDLRTDSGIYQGALPGIPLDLSDTSALQQEDVLYAFYLTNEVKLGDHWKVTGGFGQGQRPPTLIERYADGLFLSILQSGLTHVVGDPRLHPERDWQVDMGLSMDYEVWRAHVNVFQAWVTDYVTFSGTSVVSPVFPDARLVQFINTPLASLTGFDVGSEYDLNDSLTAFGRMAYTQGQDEDINAPLPAMSPIESTVGLRLHDTEKGKHWGFETSVRMVAAQDRLGAIHDSINGGALTVESHTPGFAVCDLRSYYNISKNFSVVGGIDNVFNENYQEHLDIRYAPIGPYSALRVLEPGFSPYFGVNCVF